MTTPESLPALLDQLDKLRAEGTPGPWRPSGIPVGEWQPVVGHSGHCSATGTSNADAALIVAAVNALPTLIAAIRERDERIERVRALADEWTPLTGQTTWRAASTRISDALDGEA